MDTTRHKLFFAACYLAGGLAGLLISKMLELPPQAHVFAAIAGFTFGTVVWARAQSAFEHERAKTVRPTPAIEPYKVISQQTELIGPNVVPFERRAP